MDIKKIIETLRFKMRTQAIDLEHVQDEILAELEAELLESCSNCSNSCGCLQRRENSGLAEIIDRSFFCKT